MPFGGDHIRPTCSLIYMYYSIFVFLFTTIIYIFFICSRLALAEEDSELTRTARLAQIFKHIYSAIASYKGMLLTI